MKCHFFFSAFGHFCEAILLFLANADKETIAKVGVFAAMYSGEVYSAYEMMVGQWVNKNESSVSPPLKKIDLKETQLHLRFGNDS